MKDSLIAIAMNVGFAAAVYFGLAQGVAGAQHVASFVVWALCAPMSLYLLASKAAIEKLAEQPTSRFRRSLGLTTGWFCLGMFVWYGWLFSACAWALFMLAGACAREEVKKLRGVK